MLYILLSNRFLEQRQLQAEISFIYNVYFAFSPDTFTSVRAGAGVAFSAEL
jgi:hypothetical protein